MQIDNSHIYVEFDQQLQFDVKFKLKGCVAVVLVSQGGLSALTRTLPLIAEV